MCVAQNREKISNCDWAEEQKIDRNWNLDNHILERGEGDSISTSSYNTVGLWNVRGKKWAGKSFREDIDHIVDRSMLRMARGRSEIKCKQN